MQEKLEFCLNYAHSEYFFCVTRADPFSLVLWDSAQKEIKARVKVQGGKIKHMRLCGSILVLLVNNRIVLLDYERNLERELWCQQSFATAQQVAVAVVEGRDGTVVHVLAPGSDVTSARLYIVPTNGQTKAEEIRVKDAVATNGPFQACALSKDGKVAVFADKTGHYLYVHTFDFATRSFHYDGMYFYRGWHEVEGSTLHLAKDKPDSYFLTITTRNRPSVHVFYIHLDKTTQADFQNYSCTLYYKSFYTHNTKSTTEKDKRAFVVNRRLCIVVDGNVISGRLEPPN